MHKQASWCGLAFARWPFVMMEQLEAFDGVSVDEQLDGSFRIVG